MGWEVGGTFKMEETYVYLWLIHVSTWQKPTQYCKAIILMWLLSCSVMTNSLWPQGLQHTRLPYPSLSPGVAQTHVHWVNHAIQPSHTMLSPSPAFNLSQHQSLFQWVSPLHQVVKVLDFSFSISPSNEYSGLIFFRIDWFDLLTVQETLKSLLQHHRLYLFSVEFIVWDMVPHT